MNRTEYYPVMSHCSDAIWETENSLTIVNTVDQVLIVSGFHLDVVDWLMYKAFRCLYHSQFLQDSQHTFATWSIANWTEQDAEEVSWAQYSPYLPRCLTIFASQQRGFYEICSLKNQITISYLFYYHSKLIKTIFKHIIYHSSYFIFIF